MLVIQKFGGSSLADAQRLKRAAGIAAERARGGAQVVAVVSARGGTTDELIKTALEIDPLPCTRELDALLGTGELASAALMAMQLGALGTESVSLSGRQAGIRTDTRHGCAEILDIDTRRLVSELGAGRAVVVAGFQGADENGDLTTLGRGGSDTTAVELAAALGAGECEIYSDVDGVYTADPRLVTGARRLGEIDYEDMLRLSLGGSQVLHSRSVESAMRHGVEVRLLSSFVKTGGTVLAHLAHRPEVCGVTRDKVRNTVSIVGRGASPDMLAEAAAVLFHSGMPVSDALCTDGVCTLTVAPEHLLPALEMLHRHFLR